MNTVTKDSHKSLSIVELQARLRKLGFYPATGLINGEWDKILDLAVRKFQEAEGLVIDGIFGNKSWSRLLELTKDDLLFLFLHCSASPAGVNLSGQWIADYHMKSKGWSRPGYSDVIELDGKISNIKEWNSNDDVDEWEFTFGTLKLSRCSRHICYIGGLDADNKEKARDTRTPKQIKSLDAYVHFHVARYPHIVVVGHNQVQNKACPSFDVYKDYISKGVPMENLACWGELYE